MSFKNDQLEILLGVCGQYFFMPNFDWFLQCVKDKMDVSQDFTDSVGSREV